ncbi:hypothetical protein OIDMADRAFT_208805 [Oidiodendron maius Zn]|uniref:Dipeptidylpeptidase IV N-terminal domain-containing protein n=1 Tax=Oidiodendron maius (strain Zn) TaxID=913774 RepID=A0A0C3GPV5_OIDMZ|nr:hypothetical protein OIDMADRAFT_208805 [Oidiodendron maius Zn]
MKQITTRYLDGEIRVYRILRNVDGLLQPLAIYPVQSTNKIMNHTATHGPSRAAYTTRHSVACIGLGGTLLWTYNLEPRSTRRHGHIPSCMFSHDGDLLWIYRPDMMADRGPDLLVVLRVDNGEVIATAELDTSGHSAQFMQHPDGQHILFNVGEGQDGARIFRVKLSGSTINLHPYEWDDRCLIDLTLDGQLLMTVDHGQADVSFHSVASGEVMLSVPVTAFEPQSDGLSVDWSGGFLGSDLAIVTIMGETDGQEWYHFHKVDLRTGTPMGRFESHSRDVYDFEPLGDGTWITSDSAGNPVRHRIG